MPKLHRTFSSCVTAGEVRAFELVTATTTDGGCSRRRALSPVPESLLEGGGGKFKLDAQDVLHVAAAPAAAALRVPAGEGAGADQGVEVRVREGQAQG